MHEHREWLESEIEQLRTRAHCQDSMPPFPALRKRSQRISKLSVMSGIAAIAAGGLLVPPAPLWLLGIGVGAGAASAKTAQQELSKARRDAELEHFETIDLWLAECSTILNSSVSSET